MARVIRCLLLILVFLATPVSAAWAGTADEAQRQLDFAQAELASGDFDRALSSAESALRLDPTAYESILLKARAYEGLGQLELAESLVLAFGEFVGGLEDDSDAVRLLERIRSAQEVRRRPALRGRRESRHRPLVVPQSVPLERPERIDPAPYRHRVVEALSAGRCNAASAAAVELTQAAPEQAEGWRLLGDAKRCRGALREALLAYRRYAQGGGDEASTLALIERLAGTFGTVLVAVEAPDKAAPVRARLLIGDEEKLGEPTPDGRRRLRDLPIDQEFTLTISGRGLRPSELTIAPLNAGEVREIVVSPEWLGLATVAVADHPEDLQVQLLTEDAEVVAEPGEAYVLSATSAWAIVENEFGVQSVELAVEPDAVVTFDPSQHLPSRLAVAGVPAGSTVTLRVTADDGSESGWVDVLPYDVGSIDLDTGVRVAPAHNVDSMPGGVGTLTVEHPELGEGTADVVLEDGTLNAATFDWGKLPGVRRVADRYGEWQAQQKDAKQRRQGAGALAVASGVLASVGAGLLVGTLVTEQTLDAARDAAVVAHANGDPAGLTTATDTFRAARQRQRWLAVAGGPLLAVGGAGLVVSFRVGRNWRPPAPWPNYGD